MRTLTAIVVAASLALPVTGFAAGSGGSSDSTKPPSSTKTSKSCFFGKVYDPATKKCVKADKSSALDDDTLYGAVRELAYAGKYEHAQVVLHGLDLGVDDDVARGLHREVRHPPPLGDYRSPIL